jgi:hypothetical protein
MSSMLRAYGIDTSIVGGGGNESSEKKIVLDNLEQMWPLTPVSVTLGMFRISRAMLWKSIVKSCNREIPEFLYATISSFIQPTRTREENAVAMEMVAGALRATKSAPARMIEILKPALLGCSNGKKEREKERVCCLLLSFFFLATQMLIMTSFLCFGSLFTIAILADSSL